MARERRRSGREPFPEPDTLPLMNVILMLILAMMTMSALLPLGFLSSEAQKLSSGLGAGAIPEKEEKKPLNLIVFITNDGFNISIYGDVKMGEVVSNNPSSRLPLVPLITLPDGSKDYDYQGLENKLVEYKQLDKDEQLMVITADPEVKFDVVVQTMDVARFDPEKQPLFPKVSFAAGIVG